MFYVNFQFEKLDFGESDEISGIYTADVAIVDVSLATQQSTLFYHLGVRESCNMKMNILLYNDVDQQTTLRVKLSSGNYTFVSYSLSEEDQTCLTTSVGFKNDESVELLQHRLKKLLQDVEIQCK